MGIAIIKGNFCRVKSINYWRKKYRDGFFFKDTFASKVVWRYMLRFKQNKNKHKQTIIELYMCQRYFFFFTSPVRMRKWFQRLIM